MKFNIKKSLEIVLVAAVCLIMVLGFTGCKTSTPAADTVTVKESDVVAESQQKEKMFYGLHHIGIYVVDRDESVAFYRDHLGFTLDFTEEVEAGNGFLKIAVMRQNGINVELLQLVDSSQVKQQAEQTWNHFALYVKDIDKAIADLKAAGIDTFEGDNPILNVPGFGKEDVQAAFFRGINGERIEIIEAVNTETNTAAATEEKAAAQDAGKMFYGLHHIGIYVTDKEASQAFYMDNLGFALDFTEEVEAGNGFLKIAVMRQNTINVELLQLVDSSQVKQQAEQTWNHFALYVKDIDKAIADLKATGEAKFEGEDNPILNVPEFGKEDVQAAFMRVINGERIEIIEAVDHS